MIICSSLSDLEQAISSLSNDCKIGLVPTMGALHQGHISLVKTAFKYTDTVIVSIFVNPVQFNNPDDLKRYPRTVEADCRLLEDAGTTIVFIPSVEDIYPEPDNRVFDLGGLDSVGEGPRRPGHFNGVAKVVTRLFDLTKPTYAFFGEKDFQQLAIIRFFTRQLGYPVEIIPCPIFREDDGLAMSSRNTLLDSEQRNAAPAIYKALSNASRLADQRELSPKELIGITVREINSNPYLNSEYVEIVNSLTLQPVTGWDEAAGIQMWVAVFAGEIRLIDNIKLK
ncbi:MAG: pantoate--beta-alanine ligase [Bacteroidales bacterium]|nr:pantoate--beta-alanine ligase [Bacteroidales bacterium]